MGETAFAATWLARTVESLCATTGAVTVRTATVRALRLAAAKTCGRGTAGSDVRTGDSVRAEPVPAFGLATARGFAAAPACVRPEASALSAFATAAPPTRAAPTPSVSAPAPSHA